MAVKSTSGKLQPYGVVEYNQNLLPATYVVGEGKVMFSVVSVSPSVYLEEGADHEPPDPPLLLSHPGK